MRSRLWWALALAGLILRIAVLPLPGAGDVDPWKVWAYHAVHDGVTRLYGTATPPRYVDFTFGRYVAPVNYPPLALYELGAAGWMYSLATGGRFPDSTALTVTLKSLPVLFEIGTVGVILASVRRIDGGERARSAASAYWLNPAAILCAGVGGYLDALPALPAVASLAAAVAGRPFAAGALTAAAALTKPQGALVLPAALLAVWNSGDVPPPARLGRVAAMASGALAVTSFVLAPIVAAGVGSNMVFMLQTMTADRSLSMDAYNFWWLAGHAMNAGYASLRGATVWAALRAPVSSVSLDRAAAHGLPHLRAAGTAASIAVAAWGVWVARRAPDLPLLSAIAAFCVCAYAVLATGVHENHAFLAVPLLVLAAAGRRRLTPVLIAVSAWFTLNLAFYGLADDGRFAIPRTFTVVDTTLLVAVLGCGSLGWFAKALSDEAGRPRDARFR